MKLVETVNEFFAIYAKLDPTTKKTIEFQLVNRKNNNTVVAGLSSIEEARNNPDPDAQAEYWSKPPSLKTKKKKLQMMIFLMKIQKKIQTITHK